MRSFTCHRLGSGASLPSYEKTLWMAYRSMSRLRTAILDNSRSATLLGLAATAVRHASYAEVSRSCSLLGVTLQTDAKDLKKKYRDLVKKHHPDTGGSEEKMKELGVAYNTLKGLSKREKAEFSQMSGRGGPSASGAPGTENHFHQRARGHSRWNQNQANPQQTAYDYQQAYQAQRSRMHQRYGGGYSSDPFQRQAHSEHMRNPNYNPFAKSADRFEEFFRMASGQRNPLQPRVNIMTMFVAYMLFFALATVMVRRYRDWQNADGWTQAERLSRHEQLEELQRMRQELREKMQLSQQARQQNRNNAGERSRDLQGIDVHAQLMQRLLKGWPSFDPKLGTLMRHAADPVGVVYFVPTDPANRDGKGVENAYGMQPIMQSWDSIGAGHHPSQQPFPGSAGMQRGGGGGSGMPPPSQYAVQEYMSTQHGAVPGHVMQSPRSAADPNAPDYQHMPPNFIPRGTEGMTVDQQRDAIRLNEEARREARGLSPRY